MDWHTVQVILFVIVLLLVDLYVLKGIRGAFYKRGFVNKTSFAITYWAISILLITGLILVIYVKVGFSVRLKFLVFYFVQVLFKVCYLPFILLSYLKNIRSVKRSQTVNASAVLPVQPSASPGIPRSEFLLKAGLLAGAIPLAAMKLEMRSGLYDYQIVQRKLYLPNLPKAFDGMKLAQISDIHSGSFYDKKAVMRGVEMLMQQKADVIFFTGDLVDSVASEMVDYQDIFSKVKAPLGVYSSLGNHDYGDYGEWANPADKQKNFDDIVKAHKNMGWDLLRNENRRLKVNGEELGILGVENWGLLSRFPKRGRMDLATKNTNDLPVKLLLSHDPSHWRAQVLPHYPDIDCVFAGHTHGMQMGVRTEHFQWSPIEYLYNEWAGFYRQGHQQIYVNVGYGFLGFSGRVGILPEITIFELKAAADPKLTIA